MKERESRPNAARMGGTLRSLGTAAVPQSRGACGSRRVFADSMLPRVLYYFLKKREQYTQCVCELESCIIDESVLPPILHCGNLF